MRCNGQYNTSMVTTELDGSLDDPSYISTLPEGESGGNQNVFPFSLSLAGLEINMMLHYLLALEWWPRLHQQDYQFVLGAMRHLDGECRASCEIRQRLSLGDLTAPHYLKEPAEPRLCPAASSCQVGPWRRLFNKVWRGVAWLKGQHPRDDH